MTALRFNETTRKLEPAGKRKDFLYSFRKLERISKDPLVSGGQGGMLRYIDSLAMQYARALWSAIDQTEKRLKEGNSDFPALVLPPIEMMAKDPKTHKEFFAALEKIRRKFKFKVFTQEQALAALDDLKANFTQYSDECRSYYFKLDQAFEDEVHSKHVPQALKDAGWKFG